jgi:uncharacterized protein YndB with AHSA1/START domain
MNTATEVPTTLVIERQFSHPLEKLWRALTESPLIAQWLMNNDFEPKPGHKFQFRSDPVPNWDGIIDCEVQIVDHLKQLSYSWGTLGHGTVVLWTLTPTEAGTQLRMEQSGFAPDQKANYNGAKYGWNNFLNKLEALLSSPEQANNGGAL